MITTASDIFAADEILEIRNWKSRLSTKFIQKLGQLPAGLVDFIWRNGILTGGAMSSLYHSDEHPKDYDIYLKDDKALLEFKEICKKYQDEIAVYDTKYSEQNVGNKVITTWATTFKHDIQVITHGNAEVQRPEFDFIHCMPWYDIIQTNLYVSREQYDCIRDKILVKNPNYNLSLSNKRISKYTDRGWRFKQKE